MNMLGYMEMGNQGCQPSDFKTGEWAGLSGESSVITRVFKSGKRETGESEGDVTMEERDRDM